MTLSYSRSCSQATTSFSTCPMQRIPFWSNSDAIIVTFAPAETATVQTPRDADGIRWPPGRYVFVIRSPSDPDYQRWFGVELREPL